MAIKGYCLANLELLQQALTATEVQVHLHSVLQDLIDKRGDVRECSYNVLNEWLWEHHQDYFSDKDLRELAQTLQQHVRVGLGEQGTDSVFIRCFSSLILGDLFALDGERHFWMVDEYQQQVQQFLDYFSQEQDARSKVDNARGWAHALAHASDGLMHIANNPATCTATLQQILELVQYKLHDVKEVFLANEDERFANAVIAVLKQEKLELTMIENWLVEVSTPPKWQQEDGSWFPAHDRGQAAIALFNNTQNFLRSLYLQIAIGKRPKNLNGLVPDITKALWRMDTGFLSLN